MNNAEFQLRGFGDPRLAVHATSAHPAWLWSIDGSRMLWANPVGARLFGGVNGAALADRTFGPADPHRRQIAQLAGKLSSTGAIRLERLRGFGAPLGTLITCGCARLEFADGGHGILVAAAEPVGRAMPLVEQLQNLVEGIETPIAAYARDGMFVGASDAARSLLGFRNLSEAGLDEARNDALKQGRSETPIGIGHMVLQRVGSGANVGLVALIAPGVTKPAQAKSESEPQVEAQSPPDATPLLAEPANSQTADPQSACDPAMPEEAPPEFTWIGETASPAAAASIAAPAPADDDAIAKHETANKVEAAADTPSAPVGEETPAAASGVKALSWLDEPAPNTRRLPLRFMWQMDAEGRFSLGSDEFTRLIGARTAAGFGRLWREIAETFGLDPEGRVVKAMATRDTWSGIVLNWPVDGDDRLPVELSGLPIYDRNRDFAGYRGFGVCRDLDGLARLAALRRYEFFNTPAKPKTLSADIVQADDAAQASSSDARMDLPTEPDIEPTATPEASASVISEISHPTDLETAVETTKHVPQNVLPFRPIGGEPKLPVLTPVENSAFNELARQLSERLENGVAEAAAPTTSDIADAPHAAEIIVDQPVTTEAPQETPQQPDWLARVEAPAQGESRRDKMLLDLLPAGILIYRLDRLLYANPAFLERIGYQSLHALEEAGGLDALYVEPGVTSGSSTSGTGKPVTISAAPASPNHAPSAAADAHLFTIEWDQDSALALIFSGAALESTAVAAAIDQTTPAVEPSAVGHANAEELGAILDTTAEGIVMFDADGRINSCNRSAEALFGYDGSDLVQRRLTELFAPESQSAVTEYLESTKTADAASLLDPGRELLGRVRGGGLIPLSMTMGRTQVQGPNFFAVFRDLSQSKKTETDLMQARRLADRASNAKADMLARISHEVRTPLNAIIGFAEVMIGERFGALGNERYVEYMKDIRASGERVIAIINDLMDLARIETGKMELSFVNQNLNDLVESCVAAMQPQANRERIIIRTSLAHTLPPVIADARALRQITLNLIGNSIHLANAGGQVIVSTALSDFGEVMLRVRDTGHGLNDNEVAAAMEPFGTQAPSDQSSESSGVSLSLTKALVEANRAQFQIKTGPHSGTLIEVVFSHAVARV